MATQSLVTDAQKRIGWDFKLREQSRPYDIFGLKRGVYRDGARVSDAIIVKKTATNGEQTTTVSMLRDLSGAGRTGAQSLLGFEELQTTMEMRVYADELKHGVPYEAYGYKANAAKPYGFTAKIQPQLSDWNRKVEGRRIRESLCMGVDNTIVTGAQSDGASKAYPHSNIFVVQGNAIAEPAFSPVIATYAGAVNTAVGSIAHPTDLIFLDELAEKLTTAENPMVGLNGENGEAMYFLTVPPKTATKIYGLLAAAYKETSNEKALLGKLGKVYRCFCIVEDVFAPRVAVTGSTLTFSYRGVTDGRAAAANATPDVGFILGPEAVIEYEMEPLHFDYETQDYGRKKGVGSFVTKGFNRVDWEAVQGTLTAQRYNTSSALVLFKSN